MWLLGNTKMRGRSINHPLGGERFVQRLDDAHLAELVARLRAGDDSVKNEIWLGHVRLAISIAGKYATRYPAKSHDFVSEAVMGIGYALEHARDKLINDNITPYICVNIHRFISNYIKADHIVAKKRCKMPATVQAQLSVALDKEERRAKKIIEDVDYVINIEDDAVRRELKRHITTLRVSGYVDKEIAETLGLSVSVIYALRQEIKRGYQRTRN